MVRKIPREARHRGNQARGFWDTPARPALCCALPLVYLLYFFDLGATGLLGPDEPRYAAIAREMARSDDWITPRLWGQP
jgi:4-amino-4-deoxy-L-arabinose transferase-like glycosyltransferase